MEMETAISETRAIELTAVLDGVLDRKPKLEGQRRMFNNYIMEHSKKEDGGTIYAIRYPGATWGNIITDSAGVIVSVVLDYEFYGFEAEAILQKYMGYQLVFEG